ARRAEQPPQQRGLPDSLLSLDEHGTADPGGQPGEQVPQHRQLFVAADEEVSPGLHAQSVLAPIARSPPLPDPFSPTSRYAGIVREVAYRRPPRGYPRSGRGSKVTLIRVIRPSWIWLQLTTGSGPTLSVLSSNQVMTSGPSAQRLTTSTWLVMANMPAR